MDKKRYWLKLEKDFLKSKYIKVIKGFPNGHEYILFYLALMLESVETVGHLRFTELVPYDERMLASLTETNIDTVRSALKVFNDLGLIRVLEDGTIFLPDVPRLTGKESESAERVRQFRAKKELQSLHCNTDVTKCNDNKEKQRTENKEQRTSNKENTLAQNSFARFWKVYPRKKAKGDAEKAWKKLKPSQTLVDEILQAVEAQKSSKDWNRDGGQYIPYPATWLNRKGWEDELESRPVVSGTKMPPMPTKCDKCGKPLDNDGKCVECNRIRYYSNGTYGFDDLVDPQLLQDFWRSR